MSLRPRKLVGLRRSFASRFGDIAALAFGMQAMGRTTRLPQTAWSLPTPIGLARLAFPAVAASTASPEDAPTISSTNSVTNGLPHKLEPAPSATNPYDSPLRTYAARERHQVCSVDGSVNTILSVLVLLLTCSVATYGEIGADPEIAKLLGDVAPKALGKEESNAVIGRWLDSLDSYGKRAASQVSPGNQHSQYFKLRAQLDKQGPALSGQIGELRRVLEHEELSKKQLATLEYVVYSFPEHPLVRPFALRLARHFLGAGDPERANSLAVLVLDNGGDRTNPKPPKEWMPNPPSRANKDYLAQVSHPLARELTDAALEILDSYDFASGMVRPIDEAGEYAGQEARELWVEALRLSYEHWKPYYIWPASWNWRKRWEDIATKYTGTVFEPLTYLALGQRLRAGGFFLAAEKFLQKAQRFPDHTPIRARALLELGILYADSCGDSEQGVSHFQEAGKLDDRFVREAALFRMAQALECSGKLSRASSTYEACIENASSRDIRLRSAYSLERLDILKSLCKTNDGDLDLGALPVRYLGEDRQSQGDWRNRGGEDAFILCAMMCPVDVTGGASWPVRYRPYLADEGTRCAYWSSDLHDTDPSALVDPIVAERSFFNWDDGGETRPLAEGPDLGLDIKIQAGVWRLSFYFVNEYNYYEPSRKYSLYLLDEQSRLLSACSVEQHLNGVYKQFAVSGPIDLKLRLCRNLALNALLSAVFLDSMQLGKERVTLLDKLMSAAPGQGRHVAPDLVEPRGQIERMLALSPRSPDYADMLRGCHKCLGDLLGAAQASTAAADAAAAYRAGLAWQLARYLNNEPDTTRSMAAQFFLPASGILGYEETVRWLEAEEKRTIDAGRCTRARDATWARLAVLESHGRPLAYGLDECDPLWGKPKVARLLLPYQERIPFGGTRATRDLEFVRRTVVREFRKEFARSPIRPSEEAEAFVGWATQEAHPKVRAAAFETIRALWPQFELTENQWYDYAEAGTGLDRAQRFLAYLREFPEMAARDKAYAWAEVTNSYASRGVMGRALECLEILVDKLPGTPAKELDVFSNGMLPDYKQPGEALTLRDTWRYRSLYAKAVREVATGLTTLGQYAQARDHCRKAIASFPEDRHVGDIVGSYLKIIDQLESEHAARARPIRDAPAP